jgi:hypothetical protein
MAQLSPRPSGWVPALVIGHIFVSPVGAGCGRVGFEPRSDGRSDPTVEGLLDAPDLPGAVVAEACVSPVPSCDFPGPNTCGCWGTTVARAAGLSEHDNVLTITPFISEAGGGGCTRPDVPLTSAGVFVRVNPLGNASSRTALAVGPYILEMSGATGAIHGRDATTTLADVPFDAVAMPWWRIRPVTDGVGFEVSPDATTWTSLGSVGAILSSSYPVTIIAEELAIEDFPGAAEFSRLNLCP